MKSRFLYKSNIKNSNKKKRKEKSCTEKSLLEKSFQFVRKELYINLSICKPKTKEK